MTSAYRSAASVSAAAPGAVSHKPEAQAKEFFRLRFKLVYLLSLAVVVVLLRLALRSRTKWPLQAVAIVQLPAYRRAESTSSAESSPRPLDATAPVP